MLFKKNVHKKQTPGERSEPSDRESEAFFNCPGICPGILCGICSYVRESAPEPRHGVLLICPGIPMRGIFSFPGKSGVKTLTRPPQEITDAFPEKGIITSGKERI